MAALMCLKGERRRHRLSKQPMFIPAFATAVDILNVMSFVELQITNDVLKGGGETNKTKQTSARRLGYINAATASLGCQANELDTKFRKLEWMLWLNAEWKYEDVNEKRRESSIGTTLLMCFLCPPASIRRPTPF